MLPDTVVIGLGNPLLTDDTVGLIVIDRLCSSDAVQFPQVQFKKNYSGGFDLIYDLINFKKCIIVDSICTNQAPAGYCHEIHLDDLSKLTEPHHFNSHGINLPMIMEFGKKCGFPMPDEVVIYGIEGTDFKSFSFQPEKKILDLLNKVIEKIKNILYNWNQ